MKAAFWIAAIFCLLLVSEILFADTIALRNGRELHGKVIKENEEEIVIQIANAGTITVSRRDVVSIRKDEKDAIIPPPSRVIEEEKPAPVKEKHPEMPPKKEEPAAKEPEEKEPEPDPKLKAKIDELIVQLGHSTSGYRRNAKAELAKIGKSAVSALIKALQEAKKPWQRQSAAELLGAIGDKRAIEPLIGALSDADQWVRSHAINSLSTLTNQTFGFVYDAPEWQRREAIKKWQEWLAKKKEEEARKKEKERKIQEEKERSEEKPETAAPK